MTTRGGGLVTNEGLGETGPVLRDLRDRKHSAGPAQGLPLTGGGSKWWGRGRTREGLEGPG